MAVDRDAWKVSCVIKKKKERASRDVFGRSEVVVRSKRVPLQAALRHPFPMRDQPYNECGMEQSLFRAWEGELRRK